MMIVPATLHEKHVLLQEQLVSLTSILRLAMCNWDSQGKLAISSPLNETWMTTRKRVRFRLITFREGPETDLLCR